MVAGRSPMTEGWGGGGLQADLIISGVIFSGVRPQDSRPLRATLLLNIMLYLIRDTLTVCLLVVNSFINF